jgi:hypothetical protein
MQADETILVSGRIVAEFEDDASQFLAGKAEFVCASETAVITPTTASVPPAIEAVQIKPV